MATLSVRALPDPLHRRFKLLCATRGLWMRAEVIRPIERELAMVDDLEAALRAVLGQASAPPRADLGSWAGWADSWLASMGVEVIIGWMQSIAATSGYGCASPAEGLSDL